MIPKYVDWVKVVFISFNRFRLQPVNMKGILILKNTRE